LIGVKNGEKKKKLILRHVMYTHILDNKFFIFFVLLLVRKK
jgi:hypothetical protein